MRPKNRKPTIRTTLSLDSSTDGVLDGLAELGVFGKTKPEVVSRIIGNWIWENEERLSRYNVKLTRIKKRPPT
jgi:hypothetical protein